jgi:hypothetical protein
MFSRRKHGVPDDRDARRLIRRLGERTSAALALSLFLGFATLGACGGSESELQRQNYDEVIAPERCRDSGFATAATPFC